MSELYTKDSRVLSRPMRDRFGAVADFGCDLAEPCASGTQLISRQTETPARWLIVDCGVCFTDVLHCDSLERPTLENEVLAMAQGPDRCEHPESSPQLGRPVTQEDQMNRYDVIIIGAGQAGPSLAGRLAGSGMQVAVIERGRFGGTCVNNGCTPTKTLIASAYAAHTARRAVDYGVETGAVKVDMVRVKARKDSLVERSTTSLEKWLGTLANVHIFRGQARFVSPRTIAVGTETLTAERVFIDVGGRPFVPDLPGVRQVRYLTSESMMDVDFVPAHLLVVGGSYVGLEFGQMYRRFGSRVTIIEMAPRLIQREDPDVSEAIRDILAAEDIEIRLNARCLALEAAPEGVRVKLHCSAGAPSVPGTHVLLAVGRTPNTDELGLREAGIETDAHGYIKVDETLATSAQNVYALGDCNGRGAFTHTAYNDYEIVADNLLKGAHRKVTDGIQM
jgi:pyruvate/2-oxoglutarate dehydrogenase complex dihydrolipoamide dehydrogenase (E3) component